MTNLSTRKKDVVHVWSVLCSHFVTDKDSNNASLFNLVEQLKITKPKNSNEENDKKTKGMVALLNLELISRFKKLTGSELAFDYELAFLSPDGSVLKKEAKKIGVQKNIKNMRVRNKIDSIPLNESGEYVFVVSMKEIGDDRFREVARIPVDVTVETK